MTEKKKNMVKFIKSVSFILKRLKRRERGTEGRREGREEDNASSTVEMELPFLARESHYLARKYINAEDVIKIRSSALFG